MKVNDFTVCTVCKYITQFPYIVFRVEFPFLVLLASGGHCLLTVARDIDDFLLLGSTVDCAPGDAFDKAGLENFVSKYNKELLWKHFYLLVI